MPQLWRNLALLCCLLFLMPAARAVEAPTVAALSFIVIDADTGYVIAENNADAKVHPASLTKILTSYMVETEIESKRISESDLVTISENAWKMGGSQMFIEVNEQVSVIDLLRGVIIQSGNDASVALAEYIGGSEAEFVNMMNKVAKQLGMNKSNFTNASGLPDPNHFSTARDLALLTQRLIADHPAHYRIYSEREFTYSGIRQTNRNDLLFRDRTVDGVKTGFTDDAGYCMVVSAVREGMRVIVVVMGSQSDRTRVQETEKLLNFAYRHYQTHRLYEPNQVIKASEVWGGAVDSVDLGVQAPVVLTLPKGRYADLQPTAEVDHIIHAPIAVGDVLGKVSLKLDDKVVATAPLVATTAVEEANFFKRIWHSIYLFFRELFA